MNIEVLLYFTFRDLFGWYNKKQTHFAAWRISIKIAKRKLYNRLNWITVKVLVSTTQNHPPPSWVAVAQELQYNTLKQIIVELCDSETNNQKEVIILPFLKGDIFFELLILLVKWNLLIAHN